METDLSDLDKLMGLAQKNWGTKALSLMSVEELVSMVQEVADEDKKQAELPVI